MSQPVESSSMPILGQGPDGNANGMADKGYRVYKKRWLVLASVSLLNLSNAMNWVTFSPIADHTASFFGVSSSKVNMLSIIYLIVSMPVGFVVAWLFDTLGIVLGLWIGSWINLLGAVLRYVSSVHVSHLGGGTYWLLLFGQALCAFAQAFGLFAPTKVAALWFAHDQRAIANMLSSMANPVGIAVGILIPPFLVPSRGTLLQTIPRMLWVFCLPAGLAVFVILFVRKSQPPTPPSASADEISEPFLRGLKQVFVNKKYLILLLMWGVGLGIFNTMITLMQQILCPFGYSDELVGIGGAVMCFCGLIGSGFTCFYVDRTKNFVPTIKVCFCGASIGVIVFFLVSFHRNVPALVLASLGFFGFFGYGLMPIVFELGVECTYPVAEATSAGMLWLSGQVVGIVFLVIAQLPALQTPMPVVNGVHPKKNCSKNLTDAGLFVGGVACIASCLFVLFYRVGYRRVAAERKVNVQDNGNSHLFENF